MPRVWSGICPLPRARLLFGIAKARRRVDDRITGRVTDTQFIAIREGCSDRARRANLNLAFLSPTIVKAARVGTFPPVRVSPGL